MITGMISFEGFELYYKRKENGSVNTLMHQTDGKLGCSNVLSEITFDKEVDRDKIVHILKGLHLYEEISERMRTCLDILKDPQLMITQQDKTTLSNNQATLQHG